MSAASERIIVALDYRNAGGALEAVKALAPLDVNFKVGLELFVAEGPQLLDRLRAAGAERFFLDLKFHDIPNTMAGAVRSAARLGVWMLNVHASAGMQGMAKAAEAAREESQRAGHPQPLLIAVTVLTSITEATLQDELGVNRAVEEHVAALARLAGDASLDGVVAASTDVGAIREVCGEEFVIVTPGIRPRGADAQDQARINTPADAVAAGSSYLVIGRPITQAPDPAEACAVVIDEVAETLRLRGAETRL